MAVRQGQARQVACIAITTSFTTVSIFIVALRTYVRTRMLRSFGKDDSCMIAALVFTIGYSIVLWVRHENGMGYPTRDLLPSQIKILVLTLPIQVMFYIVACCIKVSILFFYLRIAVENSFARLCKGTIYVLVTFCVICIIVTFTECIPLHVLWDITGPRQGTCINITAYLYTISAIHILTDAWILALPIRTLLSLHRPRCEKLGLVLIFSLGTIATIASILRLHAICRLIRTRDGLYDAVVINTWSMVEFNLGIWCASIPPLRVLVRHCRGPSTAERDAGSHSSCSAVKIGATIPAPGTSTSDSEASRAVQRFDLGSAALRGNPVNQECDVESAFSATSEERIYMSPAKAVTKVVSQKAE